MENERILLQVILTEFIFLSTCLNLCHSIGPFCYDGFLSNVVQSEILLRAWRCMGIATAYTPHRRRSDIGRSAPTVCKYEVGDGTATTGCLPCNSSQYISAVQLSCARRVPEFHSWDTFAISSPHFGRRKRCQADFSILLLSTSICIQCSRHSIGS